LTSNTVTLSQLADLAGGRLPVGLAAGRTPGPFAVQWSASTVYTVLSHGDALVKAEAVGNRIATLRDGGLSGSKTVSVGAAAGDWATSADEDQAVANRVAQAPQVRSERLLWKAWLPAVLALGAAYLIFAGLRGPQTSTGNERKERQHGQTPQRDQTAVS
jgi:high-affinity iron transporter